MKKTFFDTKPPVLCARPILSLMTASQLNLQETYLMKNHSIRVSHYSEHIATDLGIITSVMALIVLSLPVPDARESTREEASLLG